MKKLSKFIALFIIIFTSSACAKDETIMTINKDKSVNIEFNLGYPLDSTNTIDVNKLKDIAGSKNYFIDSYHDDKFTGYRLSKKINNINDVSTKDTITVNLADILTGKLDDTKLFRVDKGFFKNTYYANFKYNFKELYNFTPKIYLFGSSLNTNTTNVKNLLNEIINEKKYNIEVVENEVLTNIDNFNNFKDILTNLGDTYKGVPVVIINDKIINYDNNIKNNIINELDNIFINGKYIDIMNKNIDTSYELVYKVNLFTNAINNNANDSENDNKTLIWNCSYFKDNNIEYSFSMVNTGSIIFIIILTLIFIILGIAGTIFYKKYKKDKEKFISKNTDLSNIIPNINNDDNQITSITDLMNK